MSVTTTAAIAKDRETINTNATPNAGLPDDLDTIAAKIASATTSWDVFQQAGLAVATLAKQTATIGTMLDSVLPAAPQGQTPAVTVAAHVTSGNVTIDGLGKAAGEALDDSLSKSVTAWWDQADARIGKVASGLELAVNRLTGEIKGVKRILREELSCICGNTRVIARHFSGENYDQLQSPPNEPPFLGGYDANGETASDSSEAFSAGFAGYQMTATMERFRERTESRFSEIEAARVASAERALEQHNSFVALRLAQEEQRLWLQRLAEKVDEALASQDWTEAVLGLEARLETRLADIATNRGAQALRFADTYERTVTLLEQYEPLREQLAAMPTAVAAMMETRVADLLVRLEQRFEERIALVASRHEREIEQAVVVRDEIVTQARELEWLRDRLRRLPDEVTATVEGALRQSRAGLETLLASGLAEVAASGQADVEQIKEAFAALRRDHDETRMRLIGLTEVISVETQDVVAPAGPSSGSGHRNPAGRRSPPVTPKR